jgi:hypothetical protein
MNANELADQLDFDAKTLNWKSFSDAATMLRKQAEEIEYWKKKFNKAMDMQEVKPAKYSDAWWKEVAEFNKQLMEQEK